MMEKSTPEQSCQRFLASRKSLVLSTVDANGVLETSVAPFIQQENRLYVYVSELAVHAQNLLWMAKNSVALNQEGVDNPFQVSAILLQDEQESNQLFARERITLKLTPYHVLPEDDRYNHVLALFAQEFGEIIDVLKGLDFYLIELNCLSGSYVQGFGQAFSFENLLCEHLQQKVK